MLAFVYPVLLLPPISGRWDLSSHSSIKSSKLFENNFSLFPVTDRPKGSNAGSGVGDGPKQRPSPLTGFLAPGGQLPPYLPGTGRPTITKVSPSPLTGSGPGSVDDLQVIKVYSRPGVHTRIVINYWARHERWTDHLPPFLAWPLAFSHLR